MAKFVFENARSSPVQVATEPWAMAHTVPAGELLTIEYEPWDDRPMEVSLEEDGWVTLGVNGDLLSIAVGRP